MARVDKIIQRVKNKMKEMRDPDGMTFDILDEMNQVQLELCRDFLALKFETDLDLSIGEGTYPLGGPVFKVKQFIRPATWQHKLTIIHDTERWEEIVSNPTICGTQPLYGIVWNSVLRLWPLPVQDDTVSLFGYALPSVGLDEGRDPELGIEWDKCLEWGTLGNMNNDTAMTQLYRSKASSLAEQAMKEAVAGVIQVQKSTSRLGF
jgi:hypothetical protein